MRSVKIIHPRIRSKIHSRVNNNVHLSNDSLSRVDENLSRTTNSKMSSVWSDNRGTTKDLWPKRSKNRKTKCCGSHSYCCCCCCSYPWIFMLLCSIVLIVTGIAALFVGLMVNRSSTSTTIPTKNFVLLTSINEVIYGLWNTTVGNDGMLSSPGNQSGTYNPNETPENAFDQNMTTKHSSYGACNRSYVGSISCGEHTGVYLTLQRGISLLKTIQFCTASTVPVRDPITITMEGSNQPSSTLLFGSSWTLIYNGTSGLDPDPGRSSCGTILTLADNYVWYSSYRLLITSKRNSSNAVHYSEVQLYGY